ncbi:MAG: immunoglobulin domain-containing protein [Verrucomicrobia bacterium]|nr:immunoglobulin domain-containing protein [Verrucomicrobiota bacterium]
MHQTSFLLLARTAAALALAATAAHAQTLSWTKRTTGVSSDITMNAATYGAGKYVVVGYRGTFVNGVNGIENQITTSTDGATWTARTTVPTNGAIRSLAYGSGVFAATVEDGNSTNLIVTSPDAVTWTARATGAGDLTSIAYGTGVITGGGTTPLFIGVGSANGGNNVVRSTDGVTWTRVNTGRTVDLFQVAYGKFVFLAISRSGTLLNSSNGTTWTAVTVPGLPSGATFLGITHDGSQFLLLVNDASRNPQIFVSGDGSAWAASGAKLTSATLFDGTIAGNGSLAAVIGASSINGNVVFTAPVTSGLFATVGAWSAPQNLDTSGFGFVFVTHVNNLWITGGYSAALYTAAGTGGGSGGTGGGTTAPSITTQPAAQTAGVGGSVTFSVAASGTGNTYQWLLNGNAVAGATNAAYTIAAVTTASAGSYSVRVTNNGVSTTSNAATLTVTGGATGGGSAGAYLSNLSIRTAAGSGAQTLIVGLNIGGAGTSGTKNVLIRGIGPALAGFGVSGTLADPRLEAFSGQTSIATNDNWDTTQTPLATQTGVGAFALTPGSKDAALIGANIPSGSYSVQITGNGGATGIALAEIYDLTPSSSFTATTPRLANISARAQVGTGGDILITGFNLSGTGTRRLLIRGIGPTLDAFGVSGTLADPKLEVYNAANTLVASNDNWDATATPNATQTAAGGFALTAGSRDAAVIVTLAPGTYTAQVSGVGGTTGVGLVEIYELP